MFESWLLLLVPCWTGDTLTLNSDSLRHDFYTWQLGLTAWRTTLTTSFHFLPRHSKRLHRHQKHWHLFEGLEGFWKHFTCYYWVTINIIHHFTWRRFIVLFLVMRDVGCYVLWMADGRCRCWRTGEHWRWLVFISVSSPLLIKLVTLGQSCRRSSSQLVSFRIAMVSDTLLAFVSRWTAILMSQKWHWQVAWDWPWASSNTVYIVTYVVSTHKASGSQQNYWVQNCW